MVDEALAQAGASPIPNPQAAFDQATAWYLNQGALGATIVLLLILLAFAGFVIRSLYADVKASNAVNFGDRERLILAQQAAAAAADRVASILEGIKGYLVTNKDASEDLTKQIELAQQEARHSMANVSAGINGIVSRLDRDADRGRR